jgi:hypothetical protein
MDSGQDELEMEVFRTGDYGPKGRFDEAALDALAADYRADVHEAPLTLDHAQSGPAWGWVRSLRRVGDRLIARVADVPVVLRDLIRSGAYRQRSVELFRRLAATGRPYLRAVSLLGAAAPEVKGLRPIPFADASAEVDAIGFGASEPCDPRDAEIERLRGEVALFAEREAARETAVLVADLRAAGVRVGDDDARALSALLRLARGGPVVFAEGPQALAQWLRAFLLRGAMRPPLGEEAAGAAGPAGGMDTLTFDERTDPASARLHLRALALQRETPGLAYAAALSAASRESERQPRAF